MHSNVEVVIMQAPSGPWPGMAVTTSNCDTTIRVRSGGAFMEGIVWLDIDNWHLHVDFGGYSEIYPYMTPVDEIIRHVKWSFSAMIGATGTKARPSTKDHASTTASPNGGTLNYKDLLHLYNQTKTTWGRAEEDYLDREWNRWNERKRGAQGPPS